MSPRRLLVAAALALTLLGSAGCSAMRLPNPADAARGGADGSAGSGGAADVAGADEQGPPPPVALVIDASGTMAKNDVAPSRMAVAKSAARQVIASTAAEANLALLAYGTGTDNSEGSKKAGCQDVKTLVPSAPLADGQRTGLLAAVDGLAPSGYTPIGLALQKGAEALGGTGTVVLISDGEDTCAPPDPCQVARDLKAKHPDLTVATVGFRTDPAAREQLACIADATGGLFVSADDPGQLTRRLGTATSRAARGALTTTGVSGAEIGAAHRDLVAADPQFPALDGAERYSGAVPGRDLVVIVYRDCDYIFDGDTLVALQPKRPVTVDRVQQGDPVTTAVSVYGQPVSDVANDDGTHTVLFRADPATDSTYQMVLDGPPDQAGSVIRTIVLCRCLVREGDSQKVTGSWELSAQAIGPVEARGMLRGGTTDYKDVKRALTAEFGEPDSIRDHACEAGGFMFGERVGWRDFYIVGWGEEPGRLHFDGWAVEGPNTPVPMHVAAGFHLGEHKSEAAAGGLIDQSDDVFPMMSDGTDNGITWWLDWETDRVVSVATVSPCE